MEDVLKKFPELKDNIKMAQELINDSSKILEDIVMENEAFVAERQKKCSNGQHEFVALIRGAIDGVKWCKYCGTVKFVGGTIYPEYPHFLEHQRKKGE